MSAGIMIEQTTRGGMKTGMTSGWKTVWLPLFLARSIARIKVTRLRSTVVPS